MMEVMLPSEGSVLGIDVGCSETKRSSAICRLDWTATTVDWVVRRFRATEDERVAAITALADRPLLAAAFDGPLRRGLDEIGAYRRAERLLTLGFQPRIGKPGQSNSPVGRLLNRHANACARAVLATGTVRSARHPHAIDDRAIVEAFPSAWLGMLIADPETLDATRKDRSDRFYRHAADRGILPAAIAHLLPGRSHRDFASVTDHDERAALVCSLTALGVAAQDYVAVGDAQGWIVQPPAVLIQRWARDLLTINDARCGGGVAVVGRPDEDEAHIASGAERRAACQCGKLSVTCSVEPVRVSVCHCLACQRRSGPAFAAQARFPADCVTMNREARTWRRTGDEGGGATFHFCPDCGSTVYYRADSQPDLVAVALGAFADPTFPSPQSSNYEGRRQSWVAITGDIEHHD